MNDLILNTRLDSLEASLRKVQNLLGWMSKRQTELAAIDRLLSGSLATVSGKIAVITDYIFQQKRQALKEGGVTPELRAAETAGDDLTSLAGVNGGLVKAITRIGSLSKVCNRINTQDALSYEGVLGTKAAELLGPVSKLREQKTATPAVWQEYETTLKDAQKLFADFSEFLAGLALRESGFDEDICEMADALLHSFQGSSRNDLLTIPIPHEIVMEVLQKIVRLSFPQWTFWSLPMVAYEFWLGYTSKSEEIKTEFEKQSGGLKFSDPTLYLGDAFATFSMGPAYAYYAFHLLLNPVDTVLESSGQKRTVASERAEIILGVLDWMSNQDKAKPWFGRIEDLRKSWNTVVAENHWVGALDEKVSDRVRTIASSLRLSQHTFPFPTNHWERVTNLQNVLTEAIAKYKDDQAFHIPDKEMDPTWEVREIVNAAWLARLENPDDIDSIAKQASSLCERIVKGRRPAKQAGGPEVKMAVGY